MHVHEPMTPAIGVGGARPRALPGRGDVPRVGDARLDEGRHAALGLPARPRSTRASRSPRRRAQSAQRTRPATYEIIPNGVLVPPEADPGGRDHTVLFVGRQEQRKGLPVLLRAWPAIRERTGARLRIVGADPLAVRLLVARAGLQLDGVDVLGFLSQDELTRELLAAKVMAAPSLGGESFGMVLTRAFACATPVVASDIPGYRDVMSERPGCWCRPATSTRSRTRSSALLEDEHAPPRARRQRACASRRSTTPGTRIARAAPRRLRAGARPVPDAGGRRMKEGARRQLVAPHGASSSSRSLLSRRCSGGAGPSGTSSPTSSISSSGAGSSRRSCSTCLGRDARARLADRHRPGAARPARRRSAGRSPPSASGCSRTPCCPGATRRVRARRRAHAADAGRSEGATATLLGTVFAHRVFDLCRRCS